MSRTHTLSAGFAVATLALFALTGCGAPASAPASSAPAAQSPSTEGEAPAGDQSTAEACSILQTELTDLGNEINAATTDVTASMESGDTTAARETFAKVGTRIDEISGKVTNPEVSAAFESYSSAWGEFETVFVKISDAVDAKDKEGVKAAAQEITTGVSSFTDAAGKIGEACNG
ncbi:hypothetical protein [Microbacterium sp. MM2322]|uniref:hypothetical protein n=1 Tax=Microbacterium sp. MM2322 TaxID=3157631 RepID=UPI0032D5ABAE